MPICRTCRGEYLQQDILCPNCGKALGRAVQKCRHCGADTGGVYLCPRCKSDVSAWEKETLHLGQFILRGGFLGLLPSLLAIGVWLAYWEAQQFSLHRPLATLVSVALSLVVFMLLYIKRLFWRERWWASQVYQVKAPPLMSTLAGSFVLAIGFAVLAYVFKHAWHSAEAKPLWQQLAFAAVYALIYVFATVGMTLIIIQSYMDRLDTFVPQPIFVHTDRLLQVVAEGALHTLNTLSGKEVQNVFTVEVRDRHYEVLEFARLPKTGGLSLLLQEHKPLYDPRIANGVQPQWVAQTWRVEADRWGRIQTIHCEDDKSSPRVDSSGRFVSA